MVELEAFVTATLQRIAATAPSPGHRNIYGGDVGVSFFLVEAARLLDRPELIPLARRWLTGGTDHVGLITGDPGARFVDVLVTLAEGRPIDGVVDLYAEASAPVNELFRGTAGLARGADILLGRVTDERSRRVLEATRAKMIDRVLAGYGSPLAPEPEAPLGFAHGIAGELWMLALTLGADHPLVAARLDELVDLRVQDLDGVVYWPLTAAGESDEIDLLQSFCAGIAGQTILWCEIAKQVPAWMEITETAARTTRQLASELPTLCCGLAGQAVALHKFAALSGDRELGQVADERLHQAMRAIGDDLWFWKGATGVAMVALHRIHGLSAVPCLE